MPPISAWKNLFYMYRDPYIFIMQTIITVAIIFTIYFLQQYESVQRWDWHLLTINEFAIALNTSNSRLRPQSYAHRLFFALFSFAGLIHSALIFSAIISYLMKSIYENQADTVSEMLRVSDHLIGDSFSLQQIIAQNQVNQ